nr:hypothetical protein [Micromonospora sp. DSM 115978]
MDPTRDPRSAAAEPTAARDALPEDAVVAYLRTHAPGAPSPRIDARTVTSRARGALRRRRVRSAALAVAGAVTAYLTLALAGPLPVPGGGAVSVPGDAALQTLASRLVPGRPPGPDQRQAEVGRLEAELLPVAEDLELTYYLLESGPCRILRYSRGDFSDPQCEEMAPFDADAGEDFAEVTDAVERSGVAVERIFRDVAGLHVRIEDHSWRYNWQYAYLPDTGAPPATRHPSEEWTHISGGWWFHRSHDD